MCQFHAFFQFYILPLKCCQGFKSIVVLQFLTKKTTLTISWWIPLIPRKSKLLKQLVSLCCLTSSQHIQIMQQFKTNLVLWNEAMGSPKSFLKRWHTPQLHSACAGNADLGAPEAISSNGISFENCASAMLSVETKV